MEVVIIDAATFNRMLAGFGELAEKVERLCREHADMGGMQWLDSGDVCRLLNISPWTLQTMRENGTMPFSRMVQRSRECPVRGTVLKIGHTLPFVVHQKADS